MNQITSCLDKLSLPTVLLINGAGITSTKPSTCYIYHCFSIDQKFCFLQLTIGVDLSEVII